ncbi:hypothetical protein ACRB68_33630 [Actinomadura sp. RB68]|uniref:Uncharacterized protein n=1 Tax=Actinomadura macrotermitis TaxID=2585200 RepID=A0A7K0BVT4_9ACTN|nr:hypothetical protein [Actinomadura macrotermitis]
MHFSASGAPHASRLACTHVVSAAHPAPPPAPCMANGSCRSPQPRPRPANGVHPRRHFTWLPAAPGRHRCAQDMARAVPVALHRSLVRPRMALQPHTQLGGGELRPYRPAAPARPYVRAAPTAHSIQAPTTSAAHTVAAALPEPQCAALEPRQPRTPDPSGRTVSTPLPTLGCPCAQAAAPAAHLTPTSTPCKVQHTMLAVFSKSSSAPLVSRHQPQTPLATDYTRTAPAPDHRYAHAASASAIPAALPKNSVRRA